MKSHTLSAALILGFIVLLSLGCEQSRCGDSDEDTKLEQEARKLTASVRTRFKLPKMFDFERFKMAFGKSYNSALEELRRLKLFLARSYRAFISAVKYKHGVQSYYLSINLYSDCSSAELEARENKYAGMLLDELNKSRDRHQQANTAEEDPDLELASPDEIVAELKRIQKHADEPGYAELAAELKGKQRAGSWPTRRKLSQSPPKPTDEQTQRTNFDIEQALRRGIEANGDLGKGLDKLDHDTQSINQNYEEPVHMMYGTGSTPSDYTKDSEYQRTIWLLGTKGKPRSYRHLPVKSQHKRNLSIGLLTDTFVRGFNSLWRSGGEHVATDSRLSAGQPPAAKKTSDDAPERNDDDVKRKKLADVVWVDHRKSGCFHKVQSQGLCGSCYAFSVIAAIEWAHCIKTGRLIKFSEQYVVDCGTNSLFGCKGGHHEMVVEFANNFGLELASLYPYKARKEMCPYEPGTQMANMGFVRMNLSRSLAVPIEQLENYLSFAPVLVSVDASGQFRDYGGGVYDGLTCNYTSSHSVLIVGHGCEDEEEYWLIRNSWSSSWGEQGYMKLNKNSECISYEYGFIVGTHNGVDIDLQVRLNSNVEQPVRKESAYYLKNFINDVYEMKDKILSRSD